MPFPSPSWPKIALLTALLAGPIPLLAPRRALAQGTGVIQGRVQLEDPPRPRRMVNRYQPGQAQPHTIQTLPAVAYLVGPVPGSAAGGSLSSAVMTQQDTTFIPSVVFVQAGGTVDFHNDDDFQHSIYSYSNAAHELELGHQNPGSSYPWDFPDPGVVELFCNVHEFMRGAVIVTENPYAAIVGADGSFRIAGVPAGEHTIAFWHPEYEPLQETVTVEAGGTATVQAHLQR